MTDLAVNVFDWTRFLRRARIPRTAKLVGLMLATYANSDGSSIYPGIAQVSVAASIDYKTARRAVAVLVKAGLIEKVRGHAGVRGRSDEYRLILAEDVLERVRVLDPTEFDNEVERVRFINRKVRGTGQRVPRTDPELRGTSDPVGPSEPDGVRGTSVPAPDGVRGNCVPQYGVSLSAVPIHRPQPTTTNPSPVEGLHAAVTVTREAEAKPILRLVTDADRPRPATGNGFCVQCYADGQVTVAADPVSGSACVSHLREEAS